MIDRELALLLTGAAIALVSSITTIVVQHFLSLTADSAKRDRDGKEKADLPDWLVKIKEREKAREKEKSGGIVQKFLRWLDGE